MRPMVFQVESRSPHAQEAPLQSRWQESAHLSPECEPPPSIVLSVIHSPSGNASANNGLTLLGTNELYISAFNNAKHISLNNEFILHSDIQ